jgi:hypothetical protein
VILLNLSDNTLYDQPALTMSVIYDMQSYGHVEIKTVEAPAFNSNGLYNLLDSICYKFKFDPKKITITTANPYEQHDQYNIVHCNFVWVKPTIKQYLLNGFSAEKFENQKKLDKNVFGSFNNRPTWYRLCLVNHLCKYIEKSIISCNTSWDELSPNCIPFDTLATHVPPEEYYRIIELIKKCPMELPGGAITKEQKIYHEFEKTLTSLMPLYNDFFVDVVGVTFTVGDTFYIDEKEIRPMLCLTPFILYGTNGHLESLRGRGFKTFSNWWSEEYDQYSGYRRLQEMYKVIDYLSSMSVTELQSMYQDMLPTLKHNYNYLMTQYE